MIKSQKMVKVNEDEMNQKNEIHIFVLKLYAASSEITAKQNICICFCILFRCTKPTPHVFFFFANHMFWTMLLFSLSYYFW